MALSDLITKEDPFHIHKTFGAYVLLHFAYQYLCYFIYGRMYLNIWNLLPHFGLHLTSFIFHVLQKRVMSGDKPNMFIWEELRLHSMIFSYRALFSILMKEISPIFVFTTMLSADGASYIFGDIGVTTVRGHHNRFSTRWYKNLFAAFFSISQIGATVICGGFFQEEYSTVLAFSTLLPIQTSAFGMTLIRKNIINKKIWQLVYTAELLMVYYFWYQETGNHLIFPMSFFLYILRRFDVSKYTVFMSVFFGDILYRVVRNILIETASHDIIEYV